MQAKELREMTDAELNSLMHDLKEELFTLRFEKARGKLNNPSRFKHIRREIARLETVFNEKERQSGLEGG
ncbi:50S ribosomal protein L29 [candidate division WOR-3 bacterium]|nr:50S ribosomal protein L29 [candidate division WOR-3 bacterium]